MYVVLPGYHLDRIALETSHFRVRASINSQSQERLWGVVSCSNNSDSRDQPDNRRARSLSGLSGAVDRLLLQVGGKGDEYCFSSWKKSRL
jgi:hypothetical protein